MSIAKHRVRSFDIPQHKRPTKAKSLYMCTYPQCNPCILIAHSLVVSINTAAASVASTGLRCPCRWELRLFTSLHCCISGFVCVWSILFLFAFLCSRHCLFRPFAAACCPIPPVSRSSSRELPPYLSVANLLPHVARNPSRESSTTKASRTATLDRSQCDVLPRSQYIKFKCQTQTHSAQDALNYG